MPLLTLFNLIKVFLNFFRIPFLSQVKTKYHSVLKKKHSDLLPSFSQLAIQNKTAVMSIIKECFPAVTLDALIM
jgi:hypothetical protein